MIGHWMKQVVPVRSFSADLAEGGLSGRRHLGATTVPVNQIVGSVGRAQELGSDFLPLRTAWGLSRADARYRWIKQAMKQPGTFYFDGQHRVPGLTYSHGEYDAPRGKVLPPVELYKLGDRYYVVDGHHRVAAARSLGQIEMDAVVTEYMTAQTMEATESAA